MNGSGTITTLATGGFFESLAWTHEIDTWIVVIGVLCAVSCALLGSFLVLRRMSMMGDAISHAVLPGLAMAYLLTESRASIPMFVGAAIAGLATAVFTQWITNFGKVDRGASMGIVFTTLFAVGLILIARGAAQKVDLDPSCVLYGAIELAPLDTVTMLGLDVPRAALVLAVLLVINLGAVALLFKELRISSFDPALATTLGIDARFMHYLLMVLVAVTTVGAFEAIGSILVIAMLIVPAAAAHLLTDRLGVMLVVAIVFGAASAVLGHVAALVVPMLFAGDVIGGAEVSTSGMMATVAGALFFVVMLVAPRQGVISRLVHRARLAGRILREDALGLLYRLEEASGTTRLDLADLGEALAIGPLTARRVVRGMRRSGWVLTQGGMLQLTEGGRRAGSNLVRTHRLWEAYLHRRLAIAADHVHGTAHRMEHVTSPALQARLSEEVAHPSHDPHGRVVPGEPEPRDPSQRHTTQGDQDS